MNVEVVIARERAVMTTLLLYPARFDDVRAVVGADDFLKAEHRRLWTAMSSAVAAVGTFDEAALGAIDGLAVGLIQDLRNDDTPAVSLLNKHAEDIAKAASARRLIHHLGDASVELDRGDDPAQVLDRLGEAIERDRYVGGPPLGYGSFRAWADLAHTEPRPWVIPGVVRRRGRVVPVGAEGSGKSTLGRQVGVCLAAGLHPFRLRRVTPQRVLVADMENDPSTAVDEDGRVDLGSPLGLVMTVDRQVPGWDDQLLAVWSRPEGIDIRARRDAAELEAAIADHRPDLLIAGPLYKLYRRQRGEDDETLGASLQAIFDRLRVRYDLALWLEHHPPKAQQAVRPTDPFGTSLWKRWPDIGLTLIDEEGGVLRVDRFRADRYLVTGLPDRLVRGTVWPWVGVWDSDGGARGPQ